MPNGTNSTFTVLEHVDTVSLLRDHLDSQQDVQRRQVYVFDEAAGLEPQRVGKLQEAMQQSMRYVTDRKRSTPACSTSEMDRESISAFLDIMTAMVVSETPSSWQQCEMPECQNDVPRAKAICDECAGLSQ